jgi:RNA chaperone Hfq
MNEAAAQYAMNSPRQEDVKKKQEPDLQKKLLTHSIGQQIVVYLTSGIKMQGTLSGFDRYTIIMDKTKIIYKSAISTILTGPVKNWRTHNEQ